MRIPQTHGWFLSLSIVRIESCGTLRVCRSLSLGHESSADRESTKSHEGHETGAFFRVSSCPCVDHNHYATGALVPGIVRVSVLVAFALAYLSPSALVARAS